MIMIRDRMSILGCGLYMVFEKTHCVGCCGPNVDVFEELWGASILASYLLPHLCCHSPATRGESEYRRCIFTVQVMIYTLVKDT